MESSTERKMYIVVNASVKMGRGKIAAQACHAVQQITEYMVRQRPGEWNQYTQDRMYAKIVLKGTSEMMEEMEAQYRSRDSRVWCTSVHDAGRTQVAAAKQR